MASEKMSRFQFEERKPVIWIGFAAAGLTEIRMGEHAAAERADAMLKLFEERFVEPEGDSNVGTD